MLFYVLTHLFFSDILESEAKSALLDIKHPAIKKQVSTKTLYKLPHTLIERPIYCLCGNSHISNCSLCVLGFGVSAVK